MKLIKIIPRNLLNKYERSQSRSVSRSDDPLNSFSSSGSESYSSSSSSSSSSSTHAKSLKEKLKVGKFPATPTSVLPPLSNEISADEWSEISADVYSEVKQAFKMIDRDGDGKVTREELEALLSRVAGAEPLSQEELSMLLSEVDRDGDGCISLEEFGAISSAFGPPACDAELRDAFDVFDADRDGKITAEDLYSVFRVIGAGQCTLEECRRMISGVDKNGDGFVCIEDFSRMMEMRR